MFGWSIWLARRASFSRRRRDGVGRERWVQDLHGHGMAEADDLAAVNRAHPPLPDQVTEAVTTVEDLPHSPGKLLGDEREGRAALATEALALAGLGAATGADQILFSLVLARPIVRRESRPGVVDLARWSRPLRADPDRAAPLQL